MRRIDTSARLAVAAELGHGRIDVAAQYLGSQLSTWQGFDRVTDRGGEVRRV